MATTGGTPAPTPRQPIQPQPARPTGRELEFASGLSNAKLQDRRTQESSDESVQLEDSNQLDSTEASPLELPTRSYTTEEAGDEETGFGEQVSTLSEMESQRTREAKMRQTAEQFVGGGGIGSPTQTPGQRPSQKGPETPTPEAPEETVTTEQATQPLQILSQLASSQSRALKDFQTQQQAAADTAAANAQQGSRDELRKLWNIVEMGEAVTALDVVGAVMLAAMANLRVMNKVSFRNYDMVPDISMPGVAAVLFFDCSCCFNNLVITCFGLIPIFMIIAAFSLAIVGLKKMFGF